MRHAILNDFFMSCIRKAVQPKNTFRHLFLFNLMAVIAFVSLARPFPAEAQEKKEKSLETRYTVVYYPADDTLYDFGGKTGGLAFLSKDPEKVRLSVGANIDRITYRVEAILDMFPSEFLFNIYVYPTYGEIQAIYSGMGLMDKAPVAFYSHNLRSIYLSVDKISDRILAHEIAHAVINFYFPSPPPANMQEILAQYVDKHLWEE